MVSKPKNSGPDGFQVPSNFMIVVFRAARSNCYANLVVR